MCGSGVTRPGVFYTTSCVIASDVNQLGMNGYSPIWKRIPGNFYFLLSECFCSQIKRLNTATKTKIWSRLWLSSFQDSEVQIVSLRLASCECFQDLCRPTELKVFVVQMFSTNVSPILLQHPLRTSSVPRFSGRCFIFSVNVDRVQQEVPFGAFS